MHQNAEAFDSTRLQDRFCTSLASPRHAEPRGRPFAPRSQTAAHSLVLLAPPDVQRGRAKKRSPLEAAEEDLRIQEGHFVDERKLKDELEVLVRKGEPKDMRATNMLRNKKIKFLKSRDSLLPAAEVRLVDAKQKASDAKALLDAKDAMDAKKKDLTAPFSENFVALLVETRTAAKWHSVGWGV